MSLRAKVIFGVLLIDLLIFGVLAFLIPQDLRRQKERELKARNELFDLFYAVAAAIPESSGQKPDLASILAWSHWDSFADALLMEGKVARATGDEPSDRSLATPVPVGFFFNPLGRYSRTPEFDVIARKRIIEAIDRKQPIESEDAIAVPIIRQTGERKEIWGGGYFVLKEPEHPLLSVQAILLLTFSSMLLLTLFTYLTLSKLVLAPVEMLASASAKVAHGDFSVNLSLPKHNDELSELVRSFDEMVQKLRNHQAELRQEVDLATERASRAERDLLTAQRLAAMGTLAAGIAHEINNPLGGMVNAIRALDSKDLSPHKRAEYIELVISGLERIRSTVSRVLQFSPRSNEPSWTSLAKAMVNAGSMLSHRFEKEEIAFSYSIVPEDLSVPGARAEWEQLFLNLFLNAADAITSRALEEKAPYRGQIECRAFIEGEQIKVEVRDNGCGMDPSLLNRAMDPFFTTKEVGKGTGLGLSIVYSIVKGLGGKLDLWSKKGEGFSVMVSLPKESR